MRAVLGHGGWTRGLGLLLVAVLLAAAPTARADDGDADLRARTLFAAGEYQQALDQYAQLYARTLHPTYLRNIGRCHQRLGQSSKAIDSFREYLRKVPDLPAAQRAEVEGFIAEMEALAAREKNADAAHGQSDSATTQPPVVATAAAAPTSRVVGTPTGSIEARPSSTPALEGAADVGRSHAGRAGLFVRADVPMTTTGVVLLPGISYGLGSRLEVAAAAFVGNYKGAWAGARMFLARGEWKPLVSLGVPLMWPPAGTGGGHDFVWGLQPTAGLQWDMTAHTGAFLEVGGAYLPGAASDLKSVWLLASAGAQVRL
jgi:hypothetical protein